MTKSISSCEPAEAIYSELSLKYNNNIILWEKKCIEVGTFKECLELETVKLYCPLLKQISQQALEKIKQDFSEVKNRLSACQKEISNYHTALQKGIIEIQKAIEIQTSRELSSLDSQLQNQANELAKIPKKYLDELQYDEQHINLLKNRFAKGFSYETEARWQTFMAEYDARYQELLHPLPQSDLIRRLFGFAPQILKKLEKSCNSYFFSQLDPSKPKLSRDEIDQKNDALHIQFDYKTSENQQSNQPELRSLTYSGSSKEVTSASEVISMLCSVEEDQLQSFRIPHSTVDMRSLSIFFTSC
jgi:hypothetical protein